MSIMSLFQFAQEQTTVKRKPVISSEIFVKVDEEAKFMTCTNIIL